MNSLGIFSSAVGFYAFVPLVKLGLYCHPYGMAR
jgi:hypothetical protein